VETNALEVKNLSVEFKEFALKNINFKINKGSIMGLIGRNGAGKTTLIKSIIDLIPRDQGEVLFNGIKMQGNEVAVKSSIGVVTDDIYGDHLKPKRLKNMIAPLSPNFDVDKFDNLMKKFELNPNKRLNKYSSGMKMKFNLIMALCHNPNLIILDEPTSGLDPVSRSEVLDLLLDVIQDEEKSILFSTHITSDLEKIADYITLIDKGECIFSMDKEELLEKYAVVKINKNTLTEEMKKSITGLKKSIFGFEGLVEDKEKFQGLEGVTLLRPSIEEIMIFGRKQVESI